MEKKFKSSSLNTATTVLAGANRFQFAAGQRLLNPRVLSRMLLWCQEGKGRVRVNGAWHAMKPDDFLFLPWGHEVLYLADEREPFWIAGIHLIPDHPLERKLVFAVSHRPQDAWAKCRWRRDLPWPQLGGVRAGVARPADPLRLLADYLVERFGEGTIPEAALRKFSSVLVEEIARAVAQKPAGRPGRDAVRRAQELVESHWDRPFSLRELARFSNCSVSTLRRQFVEALGVPPYEWMLQARLRRARQLLASTTLRIKEVALQVGFNDPFQFSRTFRQRTGWTPRRFRASHTLAPK
jgi:AraC-like DNA-binding protein